MQFRLGDIVHLKSLSIIDDYSRPAVVVVCMNSGGVGNKYSLRPLNPDIGISGIYSEEILVKDEQLSKKEQRKKKLERILQENL